MPIGARRRRRGRLTASENCLLPSPGRLRHLDRLGDLPAVGRFEVGVEGALLGTPAHQHRVQFAALLEIDLDPLRVAVRPLDDPDVAGRIGLAASDLVIEAEADRVAIDRRPARAIGRR